MGAIGTLWVEARVLLNVLQDKNSPLTKSHMVPTDVGSEVEKPEMCVHVCVYHLCIYVCVPICIVTYAHIYTDIWIYTDTHINLIYMHTYIIYISHIYL